MNRKILPLQGLRALAFLGVFLSHTDINILSSSGLGSWGVSLFLILSGFLMMLNYYQQNRITKISFVDSFKFSLKKLSKLYLLHIVLMLTALPFALRAIQNNHWEALGFVKLFANILFNVTLTQSFIPHVAIYYSLNAVAWYLSVCLFLYFCFPYILRFFEVSMSMWKVIWFMFFMFVLQIILGFASSKATFSFSDNFTKWFVYIFPAMRLIDFLVGSAIGYLFLHRDELQERMWNRACICILFSFALIVVLVGTPPPNQIMTDINDSLWWRLSCRFTLLNSLFVYFFACNQGLLCKVLSLRMFVLLGDLSGNMFLIHQMIIRYVNIIAKVAVIPSEATLYVQVGKIFLAFLLTVITAHLWNKMYRFKM